MKWLLVRYISMERIRHGLALKKAGESLLRDLATLCLKPMTFNVSDFSTLPQKLDALKQGANVAKMVVRVKHEGEAL